MNVIRSKDNARVKAWVRLAEVSRERYKRYRTLVEGVHLIETILSLGRSPINLIVCESAVHRPEFLRIAQRARLVPVVLSDPAFSRIVGTRSSTGIAAEIEFFESSFDPEISGSCLFLDGVQDAGNVGTLLRSAAAFGVRDAVLSRECADPWSPKALRAGMGGQFFLRMAISTDLAQDVRRFGGQSICTTVLGGSPLDSLDLTGRVAWIFGGEGGGVSNEVASQATHRATILMPGGTESLNVAASAAVCLYEQARQLSIRGVRS